MQREVEAVRAKTDQLPRPLVFCEEWGKPLIASQPWVAELVDAAGGKFIVEPGKQIESDSVAELDPEVLIASWCGAGDRVPLEKIVTQRDWDGINAVHHRRVYCIRDEFLNTPAPTLMKGLRCLTAAIHPDVFAVPVGLRQIAATSASSSGTSTQRVL
jgi:iron complex transport system substrate-binding protein